ncbi:hypothetical protein C4565_04925 [Candidatus Parcubacteria bacterium]|nr:MAG: hypothetical protein C4565_04925 [Candidatus Parcubacteria bacterium]
MTVKITFDEICKAEPGIKELFHLAGMIGKRRGKHFCANAIWYSLFKPMLYQLVGWGRTDERRRAEQKAKEIGQEGAEFLKTEEDGIRMVTTVGPGHKKFKDSRLETSAAYDVAYHTIYEQLPNCKAMLKAFTAGFVGELSRIFNQTIALVRKQAEIIDSLSSQNLELRNRIKQLEAVLAQSSEQQQQGVTLQ